MAAGFFFSTMDMNMRKGWFAQGTFLQIMFKQALIVGPLLLALCLYASSHFKIKFGFLPLPVYVLLGTVFMSSMEAWPLAKAWRKKDITN